MDVTAMLNSAASTTIAAGQPKNSESTKSTNRSRTPWDAGGYSLPIISHPSSLAPHHDHQVIELYGKKREYFPNGRQCDALNGTFGSDSTHQPSTPESIEEYALQMRGRSIPQDASADSVNDRLYDLLPAPRHYLSDSRSSLSSFASSLSLNSASHSRFSSMSTVSGHQPLNNPADDSDMDKHRHKRSQSGFRSPHMFSPIPSHPRSHSVASATEPLRTLAFIAERRSQEDLCLRATDEGTVRHRREHSSPIESLKEPADDSRSASPSDAILIKRSACQELYEPDPCHDRKRRLYNPDQSPSIISKSSQQHLSLPELAHKRTLSAPDLPGQFGGAQSLSQPVTISTVPRLKPEPTPPRSSHPGDESPVPPQFNILPDTPPASSILESIPEPRCMYVEDCDTNSTPRKAISHLLGRNKMCTRLIPAHVWVQYCRKHYQRARYRNMEGWPPLQCELVQEQIKRLEAWSNENAANGRGPIVKDWTLALRKREQARRDNISKTAAQATNLEGTTEIDVEDISTTRRDNSDNPPQAVPDWLFELIGSGYANTEVSAIFDRIHDAIIAKDLPNMPDIEILPNIIVDKDSLKESKKYVKRTSTSHQRSKSLGVAVLSGPSSSTGMRRSSYGESRELGGSKSNDTSPPTKRKRYDDYDDERFSSFAVSTQQVRLLPNEHSNLHGMIPYQQQRQHQLHTDAHQAPRAYFDDMRLRRYHPRSRSQVYGHTYNQSQDHGSFSSPMMAPQPLRTLVVPTARQLDVDMANPARPNARQAVHQRSRSDTSFVKREHRPMHFGSPRSYGSPKALPPAHIELQEMRGRERESKSGGAPAWIATLESNGYRR